MGEQASARMTNAAAAAPPVATGMLQRKCECGNHTIADAECDSCKKERSTGGNSLQRAAHEVGHLLGLKHPGAGIGGNIPNKEPEYIHIGKDVKGRAVHGPTDLMGKGMGLRPFYFDNWRDQLRKKYKNCGWKIVGAGGELEKSK